jgi:hypothetical protein
MLETGGGRRPGDALMLLYFHFKVNKYMRHEMHCNKYKHMICQFNLHFKEKNGWQRSSFHLRQDVCSLLVYI